MMSAYQLSWRYLPQSRLKRGSRLAEFSRHVDNENHGDDDPRWARLRPQCRMLYHLIDALQDKGVPFSGLASTSAPCSALGTVLQSEEVAA